MQEIEQILQMLERERGSIHTFIEHMGIIMNNTEDPLTKELLAHLVEEEEEHLSRLEQLLPLLSAADWQAGSTEAERVMSDAEHTGRQVGVRESGRTLSVGSMISY
ncbi:hypothetical protein CIG75_02900 [Tumebacillus algifaecis]|uniref:Rubrerythrin diiron-binding domain-containing protein n=1 Tax=Tumebacillus algifaecis TaxID=1214604 RepID=A0A223CXL2_9BACL|nr:hypothetical protein [Tumebacillus algifaecis]ASS74032.1 hypothetical protein CIG75_02900 [Tumebacillus algifaecis]